MKWDHCCPEVLTKFTERKSSCGTWEAQRHAQLGVHFNTAGGGQGKRAQLRTFRALPSLWKDLAWCSGFVPGHPTLPAPCLSLAHVLQDKRKSFIFYLVLFDTLCASGLVPPMALVLEHRHRCPQQVYKAKNTSLQEHRSYCWSHLRLLISCAVQDDSPVLPPSPAVDRDSKGWQKLFKPREK